MLNKKIYALLLIIYLVLIFTILFVYHGVAGVGNLAYPQKLVNITNLIPFYNFGPLKTTILSTLRFIPLAILLPNLFSSLKESKNFCFTIILIIFLYEIFKVITLLGYGDINDVILGSFSTIVVYKIIFHRKNG